MAAEFDWNAGTGKQMMLDIASRFNAFKNGQKQIMGIFSKVVFADIMDHFKKESGETGSWKQWSPGYRAKLIREGKGGNKILQYSGRMRQNFTPANVRKDGKDLVWFNNAKTDKGFPYAAAHNNDTPRKTLPRREFMWLSKAAAESLSDQLKKYMLGEVK